MNSPRISKLSAGLLGVLAAVLTCDMRAGAQIVGGGGGQPAPVRPAKDERAEVVAQFFKLYHTGAVGNALRDFGDLDAMFAGMFGDDWKDVSPRDRLEIRRLYIETMNVAFADAAEEKPLREITPADIVVQSSTADTAKLGATLRYKSHTTSMVIRLRKAHGNWWIVDGYEVGDDSWVTVIHRRWIVVREEMTPLRLMERFNEGIKAALAPPATQPQ